MICFIHPFAVMLVLVLQLTEGATDDEQRYIKVLSPLAHEHRRMCRYKKEFSRRILAT